MYVYMILYLKVFSYVYIYTFSHTCIYLSIIGGEGDRRYDAKLVKHLNSGKSSLGTSTIGR
jgi:hypothetical protein